jgi:hypothetical protein
MMGQFAAQMADDNGCSVRLLPGLPPYGPMPTAFPAEWGQLGREGTVVEFNTGTDLWVANVRSGSGGLHFAGLHPNRRAAIVIASGDLWMIDLRTRAAVQMLPAIEAMWQVQNPEGWVFSRQGIALARLGPSGLIWHTRRLSFDGFDEVHIDRHEVKGLAWSPLDDTWRPFCVDIQTGKAVGGSYFLEHDDGWEKLSGWM